MLRAIVILLAVITGTCCQSVTYAQLTEPRANQYGGTQVPTLEEQLVNSLRATSEERKAYIRIVIQHVDSGDFDRRMVVAIQRYAQRKNPAFPFPYFERAMRFEAEKRGITLPPVRLLAGTASTYVNSP